MVAEVPQAKILGEVIRKFRVKKRLSQEALADLAGIHRTYLGGVERGERNPSFQSLGRILNALGISWQDFGEALDQHLRRKHK